ncbi:MAG: T9SS type A sorting domain-containing protein [Bacteroidia bacterium]
MKKYIFTLWLIVSAIGAQTQNFSFFTNLGSNLDDRATNIFVGPQGGVYLMGQADDTLFVPDNSGGVLPVAPISSQNFFLTYIDNLGEHKWTKMFGCNALNSAYARFAVNGNGRIIFLIAADNFIKIDTDSIPCNGNLLNVICTMDTLGNVLSYHAAFNIIPDGAIDVLKTDQQFNIYVSGTFRSSLELLTNGASDSTISPAQPDKNAFVIKYDSAVNRLYTKQIGNIIYDLDFSADQTCNLLVEVSNGDSLKIDTIVYVPQDPNRQEFLIKLDSAGNRMLCSQIGDSHASNFRLLTMQHVQNKFEISGKLVDTANIGLQTLVPAIPSDLQGNYEEIFSVQFDESTFQSSNARSFSSFCQKGDKVFLKANSSGSLKYLVYTYQDSTGYDSVNHQNIQNENIAVKLFDANNNRIWTKGFGSKNGDFAQGVGLDMNDDAYVMGLFTDTMQIFDTLTIRYKTVRGNSVSGGSGSLISKGGSDIFVGKISSQSGTMLVAKKAINDFKIFPNPTNGAVRIQGTEGTFVINDLLGNILRTGLMNSAETVISLDEFKGGVYFIRVTNTKGAVQTFKIIKE